MLDCHCHLLDIPNFSADDFLSNLSRNTKNYCNTVGVDQWQALSVLSKKYPQVTPFFGIHPWHISENAPGEMKLLADFLTDKSSFCGEIGLDRLCKTDIHLQEEVFRGQLDIALSTESFVAIHCVKAWGKLLEILVEYRGKISFMLHSFQGSREVMERLVDLGGMISYSDRVMHANQQKIRDVVKATPLTNLLLETDFPFQTSLDGNSAPIYNQVVSNLYEFVSHLHNMPVNELEHIIENNGSICTD